MYVSKYNFNHNTYSRDALTLAIFSKYAEEHPKTTYEQLTEAFPVKLAGGAYGVFVKADVAIQHAERTRWNVHHFVNDDDLIKLADCEIAICKHWDVTNFNALLKQAEKHGYKITPLE